MQTDLLKHSGRYFKIAFSSIPQFHSRPLPHWSNHPQAKLMLFDVCTNKSLPASAKSACS
jgi:hypothetical protein